jgi:glutamate decarboxylase
MLHLPGVSYAMHDLKFSIPSKSNISIGYALGGLGARGEDIDVMRVVLRDEMTAELLGKVLTRLTGAVERVIENT